jgi:hypothetical protein
MNCIVFFTSTYYLDDILPLIFELKKANLISSIVFITTKKKWFYYIKQNVVLHDGIKAAGGELTCLNKFKNRYLNLLNNIFVLRKLFYGKVLIIETKIGIQEGSRLISKVLSFNQKCWNGKRVLSKTRNWPTEMNFSFLEYCRSVVGRQESIDETTKGYDAILYTRFPEGYEQGLNAKLITNAKIIQVGYTRVMKEWTNFVDKNMEKYISGEITTPCFFFPLAVTGGAWITGERCATGRERLLKCLKVFKNYNSKILTVFKPHHKTDVSEFNEILESVNYTNYVISYLYPAMLIKIAKFTFVCSPSTLVWEAYYNGCTTVEYADYDERGDQVLKGETIHTGCVDYFINRDMNKLEQVAEMLISNNKDVKRIHKRHEEKIPIPNIQEIIMNFRGFVL